MKTELTALLQSVEDDLQKVLKVGRDSYIEALRLDPLVADCAYGPYDRTGWVDGIAKNFDQGGPVSLVKLSRTQNRLRIRAGGHEMHFSLYLAEADGNGVYWIHRKGKEAYDPQENLFPEFVAGVGAIVGTVYTYALRVSRKNGGRDDLELHILFGGPPQKIRGVLPARVEAIGTPFIVLQNRPAEPVEPRVEVAYEAEGVQ